MNEPIFFDSWESLMRVILVGAGAYLSLIVLLRISGKRTLSKMNAFDLIVTIALGSTLATVLLNRTVPLAEGIMAFVLLICLQYTITWLSVRSKFITDLVKSEPTLLARDGTYLPDAMRRQRITREEIDAAMREQGYTQINQIGMVVLETDGTLSVIARQSV